MNLLITGENGFIGKNLVNVISLDNNFRIFYLSRYNNCIFPFLPEKIDFVIHLASVHRIIPEHLVYDENEKINKHLMNVLEEYNFKPNILFTSSIHENKDTFYGKSKRDSSRYLKNICDSWNKKFVKLVFPNIFGPYAKAYHTSVVSNFCNDIIENKKSIINNVDLELLYIDSVIDAILNFESKKIFKTQIVNLHELHNRIKSLYQQHQQNTKITLNDNLDRQLFITLKSYIK